MAAYGVVLALGAGPAAAQSVVPDTTFDENGLKVEGLGKTIVEGEGVAVKVTLKATIRPGTASPSTGAVSLFPVPPTAETRSDATDSYADGDVTLNPDDPEFTLVFSST